MVNHDRQGRQRDRPIDRDGAAGCRDQLQLHSEQGQPNRVTPAAPYFVPKAPKMDILIDPELVSSVLQFSGVLGCCRTAWRHKQCSVNLEPNIFATKKQAFSK